ncbi:MAG: tRNA (adenosine(37)-N6)-threonylcarbamoyltransferase complex ATPase subunit type 1 TsaE [Sneathiella sp.]|nr:MAG: tRNA (adenosine(37)-N6)-threonylcarbamoyltransferase complex ATPase subunit type 1 TsaE [Sneathiella sp.]
MSDWPIVTSRICRSLQETIALAGKFAPSLRRGDIVALTGTLGAGKTAFARAVIQALADDASDVPSPTYNLLLTYDCPARGFTIYHYDLYRLERADEVLELDIDEAFDDGVSLIEWPDRMGRYLPADHLEIRIEPCENESARRVIFFGSKSWKARLAPISEQWNA